MSHTAAKRSISRIANTLGFLALLLLCLSGCGPRAGENATIAVRAEDVIEPTTVTSDDDVFPGGLYNPASISTSGSGLICVSDTGNHRIFLIDEKLNILLEIGTEGDGPGQFRSPTSCAASSRDSVFVLDVSQQRLSQFDLQGQFIDAYPLVEAPHSSTVLGTGEVLSVDAAYSHVAVQSPLSQASSRIDLSPVDCGGPGWLNANARIAVSPDGDHAVLVNLHACDERDVSIIAHLDLASRTSVVETISVFTLLRPRVRPGSGRSKTSRQVAITDVATDGSRTYVLHALSKRVDGGQVSQLDVLPAAGEPPVRVFLSTPTPLFNGRMTTTLAGDLIIVDIQGNTMLRLDAQTLDTIATKGGR